MKGDLRIWFIKVVIVGIVIAVAMYFLVYVQPFDLWFLNSAKYKLVKYATCSLALCSNGFPSAQVDKIGCLEYEGGRCAKTCRTVHDEFLANKNVPSKEIPGVQYFCGENNAIEFSFEPTFPVDIRSGEIQQLSKPKWVCRGVNLLDVTVHFSEGFESLWGECIMYGELISKDVDPLTKILGFRQDLEKAEGADASCYRGFQKATFTPLMPYSDITDAKYSSALYLTDTIVTGTECEISSGPVRKSDNKELRTISECKIKVADAKGRKKFKVWSDVDKDLNDLLLGQEDLKLGNGNRCVYAVLDRGLIESSFAEGEPLSSNREQIFPSLVDYNGKLYLYFQDTDSFDQTKGRDSTIFFMESADGSFPSFKASPIKTPLIPYDEQNQNVYRFVQPSVTEFNGHRYLAYATNFGTKLGSSFDIMVKDLDSNYLAKATDDEVDQFNPSITAFGDKLYLFYQQQITGIYEILYKIGTVSGNRIDWSEPQTLILNRQDPSAKSTSEGLMVAYSFKCGSSETSQPLWYEKAKEPSKTSGCQSGSGIAAAVLKNGEWQDAGTVVQNGFVNEYPEIVASDGQVFAFFSQGVGSVDNPAGMSRRIMFGRYLGNGKWSTPAPISFISAKKELMPSAAVFNGRVVLAYSEFTQNFDLKVTSATNLDSTQSTAEQTAQSQQEIVEKITVSTNPADKTTYKQGDTVRFAGKLGAESCSPEGKEVKTRLRAHFETLGPIDVPDFPKTVVTDKDCNFALEYYLSHAGIGTYMMTALYGRNTATAEFKVTG